MQFLGICRNSEKNILKKQNQDIFLEEENPESQNHERKNIFLLFDVVLFSIKVKYPRQP